MLCPKCGYISFDHLTNCANCNKNIAETASVLNGTSVSAVQVNYLRGVAEGDSEDIFENNDGDENLSEAIDDGANIEQELETVDLPLEEALPTNEEEHNEIEFELHDEDQDDADSVETDVDKNESALIIEQDDTNEEESEGADGDIEIVPPVDPPGELELSEFESDDSSEEAGQESPTLDIQLDDNSGESGGDLPDKIATEEKVQGLDLLTDEGETEPEISVADDQEESLIDDSDLVLELNDDEGEVGIELEEVQAPDNNQANNDGQIGVDLGHIDLSDLVSPANEVTKDASSSEKDKSEGEPASDPEDNISLNLESDDSENSENDLTLESVESELENGGGTIDFDVAVDDLVDLASASDDDDLGSLDLPGESTEDTLLDLNLETDEDT